MIFLDTNVVSETLRARPDSSVMRWLVRHDAELALASVVISELAYGIPTNEVCACKPASMSGGCDLPGATRLHRRSPSGLR